MPDHAQASQQQADESGMAQEYLTFTLGPEEYAIDILKVQEIRGYEQPTTIAIKQAANPIVQPRIHVLRFCA